MFLGLTIREWLFGGIGLIGGGAGGAFIGSRITANKVDDRFEELQSEIQRLHGENQALRKSINQFADLNQKEENLNRSIRKNLDDFKRERPQPRPERQPVNPEQQYWAYSDWARSSADIPQNQPTANQQNPQNSQFQILEEVDLGEDDLNNSYQINYYQVDNIFSDANDRLITDPVSLLGEEAVTRLYNGDHRTFYVKNNKINSVYEVCVNVGMSWTAENDQYDFSRE